MTTIPIFPKETYTRKEAIQYLNIPEKHFDNYLKFSKEIKGQKQANRRWSFKKTDLDIWKSQKEENTVTLSMKIYEECFEFAIRMVYSGLSARGSGIRGTRSEVQIADDVILGILGEYGVKKFLKDKFKLDVQLDNDVHTRDITPQDIVKVKKNGKFREPKLGIAVKASKFKNCYNIIPPREYEEKDRKSDAYIFTRVGLPTDHLFRILKEHTFFKKASYKLEKDIKSKKIGDLKNIKVWVCGFNYHKQLEKRTSIPGQTFEGAGTVNHRYVKSVSEMENKDIEWKRLIKKL